MTLTALLVLTAVQAVPDRASFIYTGIPETHADGPVVMLTHSVTYTLDRETGSLESLSQFKNIAKEPVSLTFSLPVRGQNVAWDMTEKMKLSATMDKKHELSLTESEAQTTLPDQSQKWASGIYAATYEKLYTAKATFKPGETRSLSVRFSSPLGRAGLDGMLRMVAYETGGAEDWGRRIDQFNFAIKYPQSLVFQVYRAYPERQWQIGKSGAFFKQYDFSPVRGDLMTFSFYRGGFQKIGDGGG